MKGLKDKTPEERVINRKTVDVILLIVCWLTISPLMLAINKDEKYMKKWVMWLLIVISPITLNILSLLLLPVLGIAIGIDILRDIGYVVNLVAYPELTQFSDNNLVLFLELIFLPIYVVCVVILFGVMAVIGWNYKEASVYVCEYFEPLSCAAVALAIAFIILGKLPKMNTRGRIISMIPLAAEFFMIWQNVNIYFERKATYAGMGINEIFSYVVDYLMTMAKNTHTNYVLANMYVYILPMLIILCVGFAARVVYKKNRNPEPVQSVVTSTEPS